MSLIVKCECGKPLRIKDELAGKRIKCPACGQIMLAAAGGGTSQAAGATKPRSQEAASPPRKGPAPSPHTPMAAQDASPLAWRFHWPWLLGGAVGTLALLASLAYVFFNRSSPDETPSNALAAGPTTSSQPAPKPESERDKELPPRTIPSEKIRAARALFGTLSAGRIIGTNREDVLGLGWEPLNRMIEKPDGFEQVVEFLAKHAPEARVIFAAYDPKITIHDVRKILGPEERMIREDFSDLPSARQPVPETVTFTWYEYGWLHFGTRFPEKGNIVWVAIVPKSYVEARQGKEKDAERGIDLKDLFGDWRPKGNPKGYPNLVLSRESGGEIITGVFLDVTRNGVHLMTRDVKIEQKEGRWLLQVTPGIGIVGPGGVKTIEYSLNLSPDKGTLELVESRTNERFTLVRQPEGQPDAERRILRALGRPLRFASEDAATIQGEVSEQDIARAKARLEEVNKVHGELGKQGLEHLDEVVRSHAKSLGSKYFRVAVSGSLPLAKLREELGKEEATEEDRFDEELPWLGKRRVTWYKYGWLHFGVVEGHVRMVRADCEKVIAPSPQDVQKQPRVVTVYTVPTADNTPIRVKLPVDDREYVAAANFWIRIPDTLGPRNKGVEIEKLLFVTLLEMRDLALDRVEDAKPVLAGTAVVGGGRFHYQVEPDAPPNVVLLFLPKDADLDTLQRLYPKQESFKFSPEEVHHVLADSALPKDKYQAYVNLLGRGGAIIFPGKDGKKTYLAVQPDGRLVQRVLSPDAKAGPESAEQVQELLKKGGKHWSAAEKGTVVSGEVKPGNRLLIWPADDRVYEAKDGKVTIKLHWMVRPGQEPPPKDDPLFFYTLGAPNVEGFGGLKLGSGTKGGTVEVSWDVRSLRLRGQSDMLLYLVHKSKEPVTNLLRIEVRLPG